MKRILFLLLTVAYFTSTSGATIYLHKCMGKVVEWNFQHDEKNACEKCGMSKTEKTSNDCCTVQAKVLKVQSDFQLPSSFVKNILSPVMAFPILFERLNPINTVASNAVNFTINHQLRSQSVEYCVLYCSFLI